MDSLDKKLSKKAAELHQIKAEIDALGFMGELNHIERASIRPHTDLITFSILRRREEKGMLEQQLLMNAKNPEKFLLDRREHKKRILELQAEIAETQKELNKA